ncbi:MAG: flagellar basal body L-ring protein FlgH [Sedimentisphaerales bacterium]|nr:flagellar basal body L-ring protein FlgH [Sedimentisphaerales bacterium]
MGGKHRLLTIVLCAGVLSASCQAGSIWAKKNKSKPSLYSDDKAWQVGDVLTIIINEDHKVDNKVDRDLEKTTSHSVDFDGDNFTVEHLIPSIPSLKIEAESSKSLEGKSDYKDERSIEDRMTVIVEDVHPNGNLVVLGTRTREVGGDRQTIQVSGIVRTSDILIDNTIRSEQVANFMMVSLSDGVTADYNEPGWLAKIFDFIWPF